MMEPVVDYISPVIFCFSSRRRDTRWPRDWSSDVCSSDLYFELAELMAMDALQREESCGCHLRDEYQTEEGEALRNDEEFSFVAVWEYLNVNGKLETRMHKEPLEFEFVELQQRSYK